MKKIRAIIEKAEDGGYSIYADNEIPLFSSGLTEKEARDDFESFVHEQAEYYKERTGQYPEWYDNDIEIEYHYDMSAFFHSFPYLNVTQFAKAVGINPSLMRKYKNGLAKAGERNKNIIQQQLDTIVNRLSAVRF